MIRVSVITVCFNEQENIARTIESVLSQTATSFEYIICDGGSTDKTLEVAESYRKLFEEKEVSFRLFSEKDGGIYNGMNNGIKYSNGEYVLFMNAGDAFYNNAVIQDIYNRIDFNNKPDVCYGDVAYYERGFFNRYEVGNHRNLKAGMSICHQAVLVSGDILRERGFDTHYRIAADYKLLLELFMENYTFQHVDVVVANFEAGGVSNLQQERVWKEYFKIWDKYGIEYSPKTLLRRAKKNSIVLEAKMRMPRWLWDFWNTKVKHRTPFPEK